MYKAYNLEVMREDIVLYHVVCKRARKTCVVMNRVLNFGMGQGDVKDLLGWDLGNGNRNGKRRERRKVIGCELTLVGWIQKVVFSGCEKFPRRNTLNWKSRKFSFFKAFTYFLLRLCVNSYTQQKLKSRIFLEIFKISPFLYHPSHHILSQLPTTKQQNSGK